MKDSIDYTNWKELGATYFDKSIFLAILLGIMALLVVPSIEVQPYEKKETKITEVVQQENIKVEVKEQKLERPKVAILDESMSNDDDIEMEEIDAIEETDIDFDYVAPAPKLTREIPEFQYYDKDPVKLRGKYPQYTDWARRAGIEGTVTVKFIILENGKVDKASISVVQSLQKGPNGLDDECKKKIAKWRFTAAEVNNKSIAIWYRQSFNFNLE